MARKPLPDELLDPVRQAPGKMAAVKIDRKRYPFFGGRKRPAECSVCHDFRRCVEIDGTGEMVCGPCTLMAIDVSQDEPPKSYVPPDTRSFVYDDEQCPNRGPGLNHTLNGGPNCPHCGRPTYHRERGIL